MTQLARGSLFVGNIPVADIFKGAAIANLFLKDMHGYYLNVNRYVTELAELSEREIVGRKDEELPWRESQEAVRCNDLLVLEEGRPHLFLESNDALMFRGKSSELLSVKVPVTDHQEKIVGIFGAAFYVEHCGLSELTSFLKRTHLIEQATWSLPSVMASGSVHLLTRRERTCAALLVRGMTAKAIADKLNISKRTVEQHVANMKHKLSCSNRAELIQKLFDNL